MWSCLEGMLETCQTVPLHSGIEKPMGAVLQGIDDALGSRVGLAAAHSCE